MNEATFVTIGMELAQESRLSEVVSFARRADPSAGSQFELPYLGWLCLDNPVGKARIVTARIYGDIVGCLLLNPVPLEVEATPRSAWFVSNVLTDPAHRRLGLFSKMIGFCRDFASAEHGWLVGHPNAAALRGWQRAGMSFQPELVPRLVWLGSFRDRTKSAPISSVVELFRAVEQWQDSEPSRHPRIVRSESFLRWRYCSRPDVAYRLLYVGPASRPTCAVVVRRWRNGLDLAIDCVFSSNHDGASIGFTRPTIVLSAASGLGEGIAKRFSTMVRVPSRSIPYFFDGPLAGCDSGALTLAVTDF
jgi:hypothetical protein